jgi:hypothetical protein
MKKRYSLYVGFVINHAYGGHLQYPEQTACLRVRSTQKEAEKWRENSDDKV